LNAPAASGIDRSPSSPTTVIRLGNLHRCLDPIRAALHRTTLRGGLTLVVISLVLPVTFAPRADAALYTGCRWQRSTVNVYVPDAL
jgi:hypothetical protein